VRVALVRGPNLNAWELQNFDRLDAEVVAFASRRGAFDQHGYSVEVRRLPAATDALLGLPGPLPAAVEHFAGSLHHLWGLERALAGFDIAHAAELFNPYSLQSVRARQRGRVKRAVVTVWENIAFREPETARVARRVAAVAAGADHFVGISERSRFYLESAGVPPDRITVQPMGIDLERFRPAEAARDEGPLRILCVARLVAEKGVEDLVLALKLLAGRGVDAELRLIGGGPLEPRLREMAASLGIQDRVEVGVTLRHEEMPAAFHAADVFVLPSGPRTTWREQFGFAVVEAMASGLPVLAGNSGSLPEVVADSDSLVTPHDPHGLADALAALAADPQERARQAARNRAWAEQRYDSAKVARALDRLYADVLARPPRD
jgi:phosphatidylinositol alpha-1,6-mannosyltransferase